MKINTWRLIALTVLNLLILLHVWAWFMWGFRAFGHSDPREFFVMLGTGAVGIGAVIMIVATIGTVLGGRIFCGWACHMGAWREFALWTQAKLKIKRQILHSRLTYVLPVMLAVGWMLHYGVPTTWQESGFPTEFYWDASDVTPFADTSSPDRVHIPGVFAALFVLVFMVQFFVGSKGVCRYLCPFAPFFRAADKIAIFRLRAVNNSCDGCNECNRVCLMGIDVVGELKEHGQVNDSQCVKCFTCVDACHTKTIGYTAKSVDSLGIERTAPKRPWLKRLQPFALDLVLAAAIVAVFWLVPFENLALIIGEDGEGFMLLVPLILFAGLVVFNTVQKAIGKTNKAPEPELIQIGGRLPKKALKNERSRKWNSLGKGWRG